eukprot:4564628-Pyramimonas_sp.AAC.1
MFYSVHSPGKRCKPTFEVLRRLVSKHTVVCLQEVHGCLGDLDTLRSELPGVHVFGSFVDSESAGGV